MNHHLRTTHKYLQTFTLCGLLLAYIHNPAHSRERVSPEVGDSLSFYLPGVTVTAIESKAPGSTSLLPASAIEHVQPYSAADLMQLLPGGLTGNPGFGAPQYFTTREITFTNGGNRISATQAEGMQIVVDGSPLHHNAEIGSPYNGNDTRFLSMNEIKQAEVVRGIPSAQYGNLTNGMLILKTRSGEMPLTLGIRYNPAQKQYTAGKGFRISPQGHTLNLLADYTVKDRFHTGGLRLANQYNWTPGGTPLLLNLSYTARMGGEKVFVIDNWNSYQKRQEHRLSLGSEWKPGRRLLESLSLRLDASFTQSDSYLYKLNSTPKQLATDATTSGEWLAHVLPNNYYSELFTEDRPLYIEVEAIAATRLPLSACGTDGAVELKAGLSWRSEGNLGEGVRFDKQLPPGNVSRPYAYTDIPFLHNSAVFAEAFFRLPRLTVQAGMRYHAMASRDYRVMGSAEPRLNVAWTVFASPRYALRLKGGAGLVGYMPSAGRLYPQPGYTDLTSFFYNDPKTGHSLGVASVHAPGVVQNPDIRPTVNRKVEAGFSLETPGVRLDMTGFYERQTGGFGSAVDYLPFGYRKYDYLAESGLRPEYVNGQVMVGGKPVPYRELTEFTTIHLPVNATLTCKQGVELTADFGTFQPLRTSVVVDGMWLRIRRSNKALSGSKESYDAGGIASPLAGFYDKPTGSSGNEQVSEQLSTNFRFITRIPRIGLVTTLTLQMVWIQKERDSYNGGTYAELWPLYWSDADGIRRPFTDAEREDPRFALLRQVPREYAFAQNSYAPYGLLNLRVSKEFGHFSTLSFFVNNLADMRPSRYKESSRSYTQQNPSPFFGLELQIKL